MQVGHTQTWVLLLFILHLQILKGAPQFLASQGGIVLYQQVEVTLLMRNLGGGLLCSAKLLYEEDPAF